MNPFNFVPTNSGVVMVHFGTSATYALTKDDVIVLVAQAAGAIAASPRVPTPLPTQPVQPPYVPGPVDPRFADTNAWNAYLDSLRNKPYVQPSTPPAPPSDTGGTIGLKSDDFRR